MKSEGKTSLQAFCLEIAYSLVSICLAIIVGALVIVVVGENPLVAFKELLKGAFGSKVYFANTISRAVPLIFCGLSVALSQRCGIFNIGAEGQLHLGAMAVAIMGLYVGSLPHALAILLLFIAGFLGGAVGGLCVGVLKSKFQISEVIAAIMLNYVFKLFTSWLASGPFTSGETSVQTIKLSDNLSLTTLVQNTKLTTGVFIALVVVAAVWIFLWKTTAGFKLRATGFNSSAAKANGINSNLLMLLTMGLCGGLAGLAGCTEVLGNYHRFIEGFSPSYGFTGIAVAILGRNHPVGVVLTSFLFAILNSGALRMARVTTVSSNVVAVIQSLIIIAVAAPEMIRFAKRSGRKENSEAKGGAK